MKEIRVLNTVTLRPEHVKAQMGTREGQPLNPDVLDEDFKRLNRMEAVADAQIVKQATEDGLILIVRIKERDVIRRIEIEGNREIRSSTLEELLQTKVGVRYDPGTADRDARAIEDAYKEEFFYFATVKVELSPFEDGVRVTFTVDEGGVVYINDVVFRGNEAFSKKELLKYMETRPSTLFSRGMYNRRTFERDLERLRLFYQSRGYLDVKIVERPFEMTSGKSGWRNKQRTDAIVYIDVVEGEQYKVGRVDFDGNELVETEKLRAVVKTMPGEVFSPLTAQEDADTIRDIYGKYPSSRYFTKVNTERVYSEEGPIVDVVFHLEEGEEVVVEDVQILGLTKTEDRVIRREIEQLPGQKIDSEKINWSKRNLHNLGYFKRIDFDVKPGSDPMQRAKVVVDVEEMPTGKLVLGAGISSRESFTGSVQLSQRNFSGHDWPEDWKELITGGAFTGGGQKLNVSLSSGSKSQNFKFDFLEPWFFDKPVRVGFGGFYKTYEWNRYDEERLGGYLKLGKQLFNNRHLDGSITYKMERVTLEDFDSNVSDYLKDEEGQNWINRLIFNLDYNSTNSVFDPTKGLHLSGTYELAHNYLGGDKNFWRGFAEGQYFHQVWKDKSNRPWVLGLRADIGAAEAMGDDEQVPIYEKLYAGGIGSVRGFRYHSISPRDVEGDEIGGELANTYSAEFFIPVYEKLIRASAFYDIGAVWADLDEMDGDPWRSSTGIGLHVKTPLSPMPIRLYWTHALDEVEGDDTESFQFTMGMFF